MFYETDAGRLQNLYLLQDVRVMEKDDKYTVGYIQSNGAIVTEGEFDTFEAAKAKRDTIVAELVAID